ncbi:MAG: TonB-dependent receptor [Gemmobacter sp.]|nr:TonB-dependent receptor [Gemmobacter sp.]
MLSVALMALTVTPALAQDRENVFQMLGRVILGAGSMKVAIDTPQAVSSLEQEDLDRLQPSTLGDLFKAMPGVQAAGASVRPLGQAFNIRGIGNSEQTASESRIIVTVDGAPKFFEQYRMGSFFGDIELFKRVEVLRGPASSTLYGSGAIGGAVNFTTKDASDFIDEGKSTTLRFKTGYDSNGDGTRQGLIFATRQGNAEFLGALNFSKGGDMKDGAGAVLPGSAHQRVSGLLKGKWTLGADADQSLTLALSRTDSDLDDTVVAQTGGAAVAGFGTSDVHTIDDTVALTWNHKFAGNPLLDMTVQLSHTDTNVTKDNFSFGAMCAPGRTQVLCDSRFGYATTTLKVENTADLSRGAWDNHITVGAQLSEQRRTGSSIAGPLAFHPEGSDRKLGLYAQGEFTWNDRLTIIPGIRVDFGDISPSAAVLTAGGTAQSDTAVSPKIALHYKLNEEFAVFGSVARTERLPTLDELYSTEGATTLPARLASLNLKKEEAETIELGVSWQRRGVFSDDDSFAIKATAFNNDLTNMIGTTARVAGGPAVPYFSNIAAAKIWGAEVEASYDAERWFGALAWSEVRSKDRSTGLTLADTPAQNIALTLGAKMPDQNLVLGWRGSYYDKITTSSATTSGASYHTHDLFVTWTPDIGALAGLEVNFAIENVFDATYRNNLSLDNASGRNAKLTLARNFTW